MIAEVRDFLKSLLVKAGLDEKRILFDRAKAEQYRAYPFALVELGPNRKQFSGAIAGATTTKTSESGSPTDGSSMSFRNTG